MIRIVLIIAIGTLWLIGSCSSGYVLLTQERASEASALKANCENAGVKLPEVVMADSLVVMANALRARGRHREALSRMDYAVIFYQLGLAKFSLEQTLQQNRELETSLSVARSKVVTYERILKELEVMKKP